VDVKAVCIQALYDAAAQNEAPAKEARNASFLVRPPGFEPGSLAWKTYDELGIDRDYLLANLDGLRAWLLGGEGKSPKTVEGILCHLRIALRDAPQRVTREWLVSHLQNLRGNYRNNRLKAFRAVDRWLGTKISYGLKFSVVGENAPPDVRDEDVRALIEGLDGEFKLYAATLAVSGLRPGEALLLTPNAIRWNLRAVILGKFTRSKRTGATFLTPEVADALRALGKRPDEPFFSYYPRSYSRAFSRVNDIRPKDLRVWFAAKCLENGVPETYVDIFQGRATKSVLKRHYTPRGLGTLQRYYRRVEPALRAVVQL